MDEPMRRGLDDGFALESSRAAMRDVLPLIPLHNVASSSRDGPYTLSGDLPPEIALADLSVAPDLSFVETSSGAAARELKRRYDQLLGVGKDVRSPFAITAFINQHGKQMYRVGARDLSAPATTGEDAENRMSKHHTPQSPPHPHPQSPQSRRRSRMSVHSFLPSTVFKNGTGTSNVLPQNSMDGTRSPPVRKLRKTRSIPNVLEGGPDITTPAPLNPPVGRPHAHSVSSVDTFRASIDDARAAQKDIFANVMSWDDGSSSTFVSANSSQNSVVLSIGSSHPSTSREIRLPFGPGVSFEPPPTWGAMGNGPATPVLREMQSFESGLTARADNDSHPLRTRDSCIHISQLATLELAAVPLSPPLTPVTPSPATSVHSPYSTEVFDVLQTSRGLPAIDKLASASHDKTIKLSLKADDSAAPRDDPRFVIWGEVEPDGSDTPVGSVAETSSAHSSLSRRRSTKDRNGSTLSGYPDSPNDTGPTKMLLAATIERWIAQFTSEFNYDEMIVFLLTYRSYISALDLGHLLISRFHWALAEPISSRDEMVRRVVRVRTFTAIRYWVVTFFDVDFVPSRALRLLFTDWLNSLKKDPALFRHRDALKIVRQLRKVFLERKDIHLRRLARQPGPHPPTIPRAPDLNGGGDRSPEVPRRTAELPSEDFDIDLDFENSLGVGEQALGFNASSRRLSNGPVDLAMLRQPLQLAFLQYGKKSTSSAIPSTVSNSMLLPVPHGALSRVIVNTIGRLGRWKRVLNQRAPTRNPLGAYMDVSAFDVEASETGDLLLVRGGVEQYLKMVETQLTQAAQVDGRHIDDSPPYDRTLSLSSVTTAYQSTEGGSQRTTQTIADSSDLLTAKTSTALVDPASSQRTSTTTVYTDSTGLSKVSVRSDASPSTPTQDVDIVSIDDLDLSDLSSDEDFRPSTPPGLRKMPRRLPTRRDFEFVRHSVESVSSMGIRTAHESYMSAGSDVSVGPEGEARPLIEAWQMNALIDSLSDEDETGDVEAALRRLEGQINEEQRRAKQSKVDRWVQSIQRQAAGCLSDEHEDTSDEEDYGEVTNGSRPESFVNGRSSDQGSLEPSALPSSESHDSGSVDGESDRPSGAQPDHAVAAPHAQDAKPVVEDAVPIEILESRVDTTPTKSVNSPLHGLPTPLPAITAKNLAQPPNMRWHHSFVLNCRTEILMQHFCMIDRELFLNIRFEELVSPQAMSNAQDTNILDWAHFLRERARQKAEGRLGNLTSSLTVVRGRFNLIANFVISEIVLTHPSERMRLYNKFIRLAWRAYEMRNYNTLVAIVAGLRSEWATRGIQQCSERIRHDDRRMLEDLVKWTSQAGYFLYIRQTVDSLTEAKPVEVGSQDASTKGTDGMRSRATSENKTPPAPSCVPFFGVYLSQLERYMSLPDLIDPTAPHEPVGIDPVTNTFEAPAHPEVFASLAPLPPSMQLEPLINVHKQRMIAGVVRSFVAAQHLASRVQYPLDKKLFQKCLKLRGLDRETLRRALALYADTK